MAPALIQMIWATHGLFKNCVVRRRKSIIYGSIYQLPISALITIILAAAMASTITSSLAIAAPCCAPADATVSKSFSGLKSSTLFAPKCANPLSISNGNRVSCMLVWPPYNNKKFETLSYLPPLTPEQVAKQVDYITQKGWIPCLEFDKIGSVYREHFHGSGYYDGRYWVMWKLPMFGCTDAAAVLREINECKKAYPSAFIRVLGFDAKRQVQVCGFLVQRPA